MNGEKEQKVYTFLKVSEQPPLRSGSAQQCWLWAGLLSSSPYRDRPCCPALPCPALGEFLGIQLSFH